MRLRLLLRSLGVVSDPGAWIEPQLLGCRYPRRESALAGLAQQRVSLLVNLHERGHDPSRLARHGLLEVHLPVKDFSAPSPAQLEQGIVAIVGAVAAGQRVAVHCGGGLGRTGTLLACYLVHQGWSAEAAIARVRERRPGSIETAGQVAAVHAYAYRAHPS
ncbi:MAG: dual specificity protein phosphatase family protein [Chloroflexota bacterium]|nr:dual specificity protein phosphatase family protein [Chloroflexota bacterium]MDP9473839.1 dual specificity protein phosphatase family protein [Chloroflexota bacterium]